MNLETLCVWWAIPGLFCWEEKLQLKTFNKKKRHANFSHMFCMDTGISKPGQIKPDYIFTVGFQDRCVGNASFLISVNDTNDI